VGAKVLAKAQNIDRPKIIMNCCQGKKKVRGMSVNKAYCKVIEKPTIVPMQMPNRLLESTRMNAS
jgi:hypothetical protein